jgi:hypothetical protein
LRPQKDNYFYAYLLMHFNFLMLSSGNWYTCIIFAAAGKKCINFSPTRGGHFLCAGKKF